jgi:hypothetical protein
MQEDKLVEFLKGYEVAVITLNRFTDEVCYQLLDRLTPTQRKQLRTNSSVMRRSRATSPAPMSGGKKALEPSI